MTLLICLLLIEGFDLSILWIIPCFIVWLIHLEYHANTDHEK